MPGSEYLLTCAEVAVALAGFSALVVAIMDRGSRENAAFSRGLVASLVERSLFALFFSLVPVLLGGLGVGAALTAVEVADTPQLPAEPFRERSDEGVGDAEHLISGTMQEEPDR